MQSDKRSRWKEIKFPQLPAWKRKNFDNKSPVICSSSLLGEARWTLLWQMDLVQKGNTFFCFSQPGVEGTVWTLWPLGGSLFVLCKRTGFVRGCIFLNASFMHFHCLTVGGSNVQQRVALCRQRGENMDVNNPRFSDRICPCLVGYLCCISLFFFCCRLSSTAISLMHKQ